MVDFFGRSAGYRYLRAKGNSIEGGTSEILRNIVAERVLGLPAEPRVDKDVPGRTCLDDRPAVQPTWRRTSGASVRDLLAAAQPGQPRAGPGRGAATRTTRSLWRTLATEMGLAGMAVPERLGGGGAQPARGRRRARGARPRRRAGAVPVQRRGGHDRAAGVSATDDLVAKLAAGESDRRARGAVRHRARRPAAVGRGRRTVRLTGTRHAASPTAWPPTCCSCPGRRRSVRGGRDRRRRHPYPGGLAGPDPAAGRRALRRARPASSSPSARRQRGGRRRLTAGAALLASEQLGLAEWCLDTTVEYVKARHQFGRPVGSFQALKHRLADVWVELTQARAVARYAAGVRRRPVTPDLPVAASLAQAFCSPVAVKAAEECVQLHGGIGFTWEHPAHLFLKRAKADVDRVRHGRPAPTGPRHAGGPAGVTDAGAARATRRRSRTRSSGASGRASSGASTVVRRGRAHPPGHGGRAARAHRRGRPEGEPGAHRRAGRGVSLRTLWTNFKDLEALYAAANDRLHRAHATSASPPGPAGRPLAERVPLFCEQRARMLEMAAPAARAAAAAAAVLGPAAPQPGRAQRPDPARRARVGVRRRARPRPGPAVSRCCGRWW